MCVGRLGFTNERKAGVFCLVQVLLGDNKSVAQAPTSALTLHMEYPYLVLLPSSVLTQLCA